MNTIWTEPPGFPGIEVSPEGGVRTRDYLAPSRRQGQPFQLRKGQIIRPYVSASGYLEVHIKRGGDRRKLLVHRLVALAYCSGVRLGDTVDHIDGNRLNNRAENLEWLSRSENTRRQNAAGRGVGKGERHPSAKLRDDDVARLHALRAEGLSYEKIGRHMGVSGSLVHKIITGKRRAPHVSPPALNARSNLSA